MMKHAEIRMLLVVLVVLGCFPGVYAISVGQHDKVMGVDNVSVDGSKIIYVAKNGTDRNDGLTPEKPKRNIINAINDANPGDTIKVGQGTYLDNIVISKNLTLIGDDQSNTIIDGQKRASCIRITEGVIITITGFTIKNGGYIVPRGGYHQLFGGGIYNRGVLTLKSSIITDNEANFGGGIQNYGIINMSGVTIKNNKGGNYGGGGIHNDGHISMENSTITDNTLGILNNVNNDICATMNITRSTIKNNKGEDGGGIRNRGKLIIEDSTITNNTATGFGGGINNANNLLYVYGCTITNNKANMGGGICNGCVAYIDDITVITGNYPNNFEGKPFIPA